MPDARRGRELVFPDLEPDAALGRAVGAGPAHLRLDEDDPVAAWRERQDTLSAPPSGSPSGASTPCTSPARAPTCASGCCRRRAGWRPRFWTAGRHRAHAEPPDRGGLHDARPAARRRRRARRRSRSSSAARSSAACECASRAAARWRSTPTRTAGVLRRYSERDDGRVAARRGRARRRRGPDRPARHGLLRHAARRERRVPHRAGLGLRVHGRRAEDVDRINGSPIHIDFMIGGPDVDVTGMDADGDRVPVLAAAPGRSERRALRPAR